MVARHLAHIDAIDEFVSQSSGEIAERLRPAEADIELLDAHYRHWTTNGRGLAGRG
jgi:hypothetical protein